MSSINFQRPDGFPPTRGDYPNQDYGPGPQQVDHFNRPPDFYPPKFREKNSLEEARRLQWVSYAPVETLSAGLLNSIFNLSAEQLLLIILAAKVCLFACTIVLQTVLPETLLIGCGALIAVLLILLAASMAYKCYQDYKKSKNIESISEKDTSQISHNSRFEQEIRRSFPDQVSRNPHGDSSSASQRDRGDTNTSTVNRFSNNRGAENVETNHHLKSNIAIIGVLCVGLVLGSLLVD